MPKKKVKARMGRPPIGAESRTIPLLIRITPTEHKVWQRLAEAAGMGIGPWVAKPRRDEMGEK